MRFPDVGWLEERLPSNRRTVGAALIGVVLLACAGWAAASQIRSPAQIAADTAAPKPSLISVPVERRSLATEVIVRGTVRYGKPQAIALPVSGLKNNTQVVSRPARRDAQLRDGSVALTVSGRPVFVLQGQTPMHRDLGPGDSGTDVLQLERALARLGHSPGAVDGRYDGATGGGRRRAVSQPRRGAVRAHRGPEREAQHRRRRGRHGERQPAAVARRGAHRRRRRQPGAARRGGRRRGAPARPRRDRRRALADRRGARPRGDRQPPGEERRRRRTARARRRPGRPDGQAERPRRGDRRARRRPARAQHAAARTPRPSAPRRARRCARRSPRWPARAPTSPPRRTRSTPPRRSSPSRSAGRATTGARRRATSSSPRPTRSRRSARSSRLKRKHRLALARVRILGQTPSTRVEHGPRGDGVARAQPRAERVHAAGRAQRHPGARRRGAVLRTTPVRVDSVAAAPRQPAVGRRDDRQQHAPGDRLVAVAAGEGPRARRRPGAHRGVRSAHRHQRTGDAGSPTSRARTRTSIPAARTSR